MALQATIIMLDNSSYSINGDYLPTRWDTQIDAATLLIQTKISTNNQSSVGLGLMAGKQMQIICTPTTDSSKAIQYLWGIKVGGEIKFSKSLLMGALALKHRLNPSQKQRIICFVGSSLAQSEQQLKLLAKKLKKNSIAIDIIGFGDTSQRQKYKIKQFINALEVEQNSNFIFIESQQGYLSQCLMSSKIFGNNTDTHNNFGDQFMDPEMAKALAQSLQDYRKMEQQSKQPKKIKEQSQKIIKQLSLNKMIVQNVNSLQNKQINNISTKRLQKQEKLIVKVKKIEDKYMVLNVQERQQQQDQQFLQRAKNLCERLQTQKTVTDKNTMTTKQNSLNNKILTNTSQNIKQFLSTFQNFENDYQQTKEKKNEKSDNQNPKNQNSK